MADIVLSIEGLVKRFGAHTVLDGVTMSAERGAFVTILGASGCGKTTTLRAVAGLETVDGGRIALGGRDVTHLPPEKRGVNTVFQNYALFPHMNVWKNIAYGPKIHGTPKADIQKQVAAMLALTEMTGFEKRLPDQLSGGQRQRVAIARALINKPDVVLLDEPLGALDLRLRKHMQAELKRLQQKTGVTFIYVTHDQDEALNMSDWIIVMNEGRVEQAGTPEDVYLRPATRFVAGFVGERNCFESGGLTVYVHTDRTLVSTDPFDGWRVQGHATDVSVAGAVTAVTARTEDGREVKAVSYNAAPPCGKGGAVYIGWKAEDGVAL